MKKIEDMELGEDLFCSNCRFWECVGKVDTGASGHYYGKCRVNSPIPVPPHSNGVWPNTYQDDWCGDFALNSDLTDLRLKEAGQELSRSAKSFVDGMVDGMVEDISDDEKN